MRGGGTGAEAAAGFTLIEIVAAVFLTSVVLGLAVASYINLSNATEAAQSRTRDGRHALAILDRMARDLEGAYLLEKPPDVDPLFYPWIFLAESHTSSQGADRLKFITRNHRPRNPLGHGSDLAVVSYVLEQGDNGRFVLTRSLSPGLPQELDREFHTEDDDRAMVVADNIASLSMRFLNEEQEWVNEWDSSLIVESSNLPLAVEIDVSLAPAAEEGEDLAAFSDLDPEDLEHFTRRVLLPLRPVDLESMTVAAAAAAGVTIGESPQEDEEGQGENGSGGGKSTGSTTEGGENMTVEECLNSNPPLRDQLLEQGGGSFPPVLEPLLSQPASNYQDILVMLGFNCQ